MVDLKEAEKTIEQPNSAEISINAKGKWSGKVKSYGECLAGAYDLVIEKAEELDKLIKEKNAEKR